MRLSYTVALPDTVIACIKVGTTPRGCKRWPGTAWGAGGGLRRIVVAGDTGTWSTGNTNFTLEITAKNGNQGPYTTTGRLLIVNRIGSRYGGGWWIAGLEQLQVVGDTLIWIGGDGSARRYTKTGSVWKPFTKFAVPDSIIANGSGYARLTAEQARVFYNSAGRHDSTRNSLGHVTRFVYAGTTDSLLTIRVPRPGGAFVDRKSVV